MPELSSVVVERELPFPAEKIWRALTQSHLLKEWLMAADFQPEIGHRFDFSTEWGHVDGKVLACQPHMTLSYTWGDDVLSTVVTWTLTPTARGTHLRMEQSGFRADQPARYFFGASRGWPVLIDKLERLLQFGT